MFRLSNHRQFKILPILIILFAILPLSILELNNATDLSKRIQSRRRRYLVFPEGSSLQLVYDLVISIPDYTNFVVTGITTALAWGLPYKPTYPETELQDQYEQGRLPLLNRRHYGTNIANAVNNYANNIDRMDPITTKISPTAAAAAMESHLLEIHSTRQRLLNSFRQLYDSYANRRRHGNFVNVLDSRPNEHYNSDAYEAFGKYLMETYFQPWQELTTTTKMPIEKSTIKNSTKSDEFEPKINKLHTIYPALGKRSISDRIINYEEQFYVDYHRKTRYELFGIIEKHINAKGSNGTACVLKTLCEIGQKRDDDEPGSILTEIARVIFSLPAVQSKMLPNKLHNKYHVAYDCDNNCTERYAQCTESIWADDFLLEMIK